MPDWLHRGLVYLFEQPGSFFNYYVPIAVASLAILCVPAYHYLLASRLRFRRFPVHEHMLDRLAGWLAGIGLAWLLVLLFRSWDLPVLSWRVWLYLVAIASAVLYLWGLAWVYRHGPRLLEAYEAELQRKRYLAGATPTVPSVARRSRRAAKQR